VIVPWARANVLAKHLSYGVDHARLPSFERVSSGIPGTNRPTRVTNINGGIDGNGFLRAFFVTEIAVINADLTRSRLWVRATVGGDHLSHKASLRAPRGIGRIPRPRQHRP
jgi:hypothetical protein